MDKKHLKLTKSRLTRPMRRFIMAILICSFFIISPTIILYTAGYRYNFEKHKVKQTGVLSIDIKPRNARVMLNDIEIKKSIPIRLPNRAPGTYHLKIKLDGYKSWEKDINISSNQTTYIKDITLIKESKPSEILSDQNGIQNIYGTEDSSSILLLVKEKDIYEILAFDTIEEKLTPIIRTAIKPDISVSPFFDIAYIIIQEESNKTLHLVSFDNPIDPTTIEITSSDIELQWNESDLFEPLYIKDKNIIKKISLDGTMSSISETLSSLWYVDKDGNLWEVKEKSLIQTEKEIALYVNEKIENIFHINQNRVILELQDTFFAAQYYKNNIHDIQHVYGIPTFFHRDTLEWWFMTEWELTSVYEDGGSNLLNRSGDKLKQAKLLDKDGVILFVTDEKLKTFNPGYYVGHDILEENVADVTPLTKQRELYFLRSLENENKLYKLMY